MQPAGGLVQQRTLTAVIFALKGKGLTTVAIASCVAVFLVELIRF